MCAQFRRGSSPFSPLLSLTGGGAGGGAGSRGRGSGGTEKRVRGGGASVSPRSLSSLVSERSAGAEAEASIAFLQLAHNAFPAAALSALGDRLLGSGSRRPLSNRIFSLGDEAFRAAFLKSRADFVRVTLGAPMEPVDDTPSAVAGQRRLVDFSPGAPYTSRDYEKLEVDCIMKVPLHDVCEWTRDNTVDTSGDTQAPFFIRPTSCQTLPGRPGPCVPASMARAVSGSSFSAEHYPADAAAYIVAEVYAPLGEGDARLVQKLLQAERVVRFLAAKEQKESVRDCVLGFIFMGPRVDSSAGAALFNALNLHRAQLPCLWELQEAPCRLLGCKVATEPLVITQYRLLAAMQREHEQREREQREREQRESELDKRNRERCTLA